MTRVTDHTAPQQRYRFSIWDALMGMLAVGLLIFIAIKAYGASFTHDESFSYNIYVHTPFMDILAFKHWFTNNHILNTIGMKWSEAAFGSSEFALRLPNLLVLGVYLGYLFLLFRNSDRKVAAGVFALIASNLVLIDYFGLARGYALSWGFMLMSLYHFIAFFERRKLLHNALFHLGGLLAVLSNFTLILVYLALLCAYPLREWIHARVMLGGKYRIWPSLRIHLPSLVLNAIVLFEPLRRVITRSEIDFGGKAGFYPDTVMHLIGYTLHGYRPEAIMPLLYVVYSAIVLVPTALILRAIVRRKVEFWERHRGLIITNAVLVMVLLAINLQHLLMGTDYPIARFSMYLTVLFLVHLGFCLAYVVEQWPMAVRAVTLSAAGLSCLSLILQADMRSCGEWEPDMETKAVVQALTRYHATHDAPGTPVRLGINWIFEPAINYYRVRDGLDWLLPVDRSGVHASDHYDYVMQDDSIAADTGRYEVIVRYDRIRTVLLRNRRVEPN